MNCKKRFSKLKIKISRLKYKTTIETRGGHLKPTTGHLNK